MSSNSIAEKPCESVYSLLVTKEVTGGKRGPCEENATEIASGITPAAWSPVPYLETDLYRFLEEPGRKPANAQYD